MGIPTNGSLTDQVASTVQDMLQSCPDIDLHIDVSIDALGEEHDKIRGVKGLFERAIQTYKELRQMEKPVITEKNSMAKQLLTVKFLMLRLLRQLTELMLLIPGLK